jgi:hypothetical protein
VHKAGGSLRDVPLLAGYRSIQTTQRYIDGDSDAQRGLVAHNLSAMVATITIRHRQTNQKNHLKIAKPSAAPIDHAVRIIHTVCGLAESATWIDDIRADLRADQVQAPIWHRDTAVVFDWLMAALSYQGISDQAAYQYMERHGRAAWRDIDQRLIPVP